MVWLPADLNGRAPIAAAGRPNFAKPAGALACPAQRSPAAFDGSSHWVCLGLPIRSPSAWFLAVPSRATSTADWLQRTVAADSLRASARASGGWRLGPLPLPRLHQLSRLPLLPRLLPLLLLAGCGPRPPFDVQTLADAGLKPLPADKLAACAAALRLPPELARPADATNFGVRQERDRFGRAVPNRPQLIVLHETVLSAADTLKLFATPHRRDDDQASYHLLVDRAGMRLRVVPDGGRAYGAGMAAFGDFTVRIRPTSVGSLNNVALHLSLETPADGRGDGDGHSGYSAAQYRVAAGQVLLWQAAFGIPISRVTTHQAVDRSHSRRDPRSFRWQEFDAAWREAAARCGLEAYDRGRATI